MDNLKQFLNSIGITFESNVNLSCRTWIHRGGIASIYITPNSSDQLALLCKYLYDNSIKFDLLGGTSNLYIKNDYNPKVVVSTRKCNKYSLDGECIYCECGTSVIRLAKSCVNAGISGYEYLTGLPGTVGGAIVNNSSCKSNSISQNIISADILLDNGKVEKWSFDDFEFKFRSSILKEKRIKGVLLNVTLKKDRLDSEILKERADKYIYERKLILEGPGQNLGCTFNSPFKNGNMPLRYRIPNLLYSTFLTLLAFDKEKRLELSKNFLLSLSGHSRLIPYISNKLYLTFIWKDSRADDFFDEYIFFMKEVFKTDSIEIEIKSNKNEG